MKVNIRHIIHNNSFWLSAERCVFWEEEKSLIISDLHFGKAGHFRKAGIAVPQNIFKEDLQRLFAQIQFYQPDKLIIVGDLFHSRENKEMNLFLRWRNDVSHVKILLIKGNHDILKNDWYTKADIEISYQLSAIGNFNFMHDFNPSICQQSKDNYCFSGHIHPAVCIKVGKQSLIFPCFYFSSEYAVLPAFSRFTGTAIINQKKHETVYAIVNNELMKF